MFSLKSNINQGRGGYQELIGAAAFTTTGTTVTVPIPFDRVYAYSLSPIGSPATGEVLSISTTANSDGTINRDTDGTITVKRAAGTTSGLAFSYIIKGGV